MTRYLFDAPEYVIRAAEVYEYEIVRSDNGEVAARGHGLDSSYFHRWPYYQSMIHEVEDEGTLTIMSCHISLDQLPLRILVVEVRLVVDGTGGQLRVFVDSRSNGIRRIAISTDSPGHDSKRRINCFEVVYVACSSASDVGLCHSQRHSLGDLQLVVARQSKRIKDRACLHNHLRLRIRNVDSLRDLSYPKDSDLNCVRKVFAKRVGEAY